MMTTQQDAHSLEEDLDELDAGRVEDVARAFAAALRSYRLYEGSNPMVDRFVGLLQTKLTELWDELPQLRLDIEEDAIRWNGKVVLSSAETGSDLPFLFYKDGIREITLLPEFEEEELTRVLAVLARAPSVRQEEDDLITLLWQEELTKLRYRAVEIGAEGIELATGDLSETQPIDAAAVREEEQALQFASTEGFEDTLYFLDEAELRKLQDEIRRESQRDLWRDVLNALLDRLEDGTPERQIRILGILGELLPATMASGRFDRAAAVLEELSVLGGRQAALSEEAVVEMGKLIDSLGSEESVLQLATILESSPGQLADGSVGHLLSFFPARSIAPLMRVTEKVEQPAVRRAFESCMQRLAEANRDHIVELLRTEDEAVVANALRWIGRLEIGAATSEVVRFLRHSSAPLRVSALETLRSLRAAAAGNAITSLLDDPDRDVRIAAARTIGGLMFAAGRGALEAALASKRLREADRTEKLAFFEAFGLVADGDGVPVLDRMLNGRSFLNRGEPTEIRACAAIALGRVRHPSARDALNRAAKDSDPVVRTAVGRALRGEDS